MKYYNWNIKNLETQETCCYSSNGHRPVSEEHVKTSPSVRKYANGSPIEVAPKYPK